MTKKNVFCLNALISVIIGICIFSSALPVVNAAQAVPPTAGGEQSLVNPTAEAGPALGTKVPNLILKDVNETYVFLTRLCGDKVKEGDPRYVVVLDFCATWCKPCMKEMPVLQKIYDDYKSKGMKMFLVSVDTLRKPEVFKFFEEKGVSIPLLFDSDRGTADKWGVAEFPALFVIDQLGKLVYKHIGYSETVDKEVRAKLDKIVNLTPEMIAEQKKAEEDAAAAKAEATSTAAVDAAAKAAAEVKEQAKTLSTEALRFFSAGQYKEAIAKWEEALKLDPENKFAAAGIRKAKAKLEGGE
ncbi:MAG: redoxin domain-containing protein [Elusimicrobiota bacterium]